MNNKSLRVKMGLVYILIATFFLVDCSGSKPKEQAIKKDANQEAVSVPNTSENERTVKAENGNDNNAQGMIEKLNLYIECFNGLSKNAHNSRARYLSWANEKTPPTGKERIIYGLYALNEYAVKNCDENITKAKEIKPQLSDIEKTADTYKASIQALYPKVKEAFNYYNQEDYKDDNIAKGKQMHAPLMAAFDEFQKADDGFKNEIDKLEDTINENELKILEKSGPKLIYLLKNGNYLAKKIVRQGSVDPLEKLDTTSFSEKIEAYQNSVNEFESLVQSKPEEVDRVIGSSVDIYLSSCKDFLKAAKQLQRRVRDKQAYSNSEKIRLGNGGATAAFVEGSPQMLIDKYNKMVAAYNLLVQ